MIGTGGHREVDLATVVDALPHLVWTCTPEGTVEYLNAAARAAFGLASVAPAVTLDPRALVHPDDLAPAGAAWDEARRTGAPFAGEVRLRGAGGRYRWHLVRTTPIGALEQGAGRGWVGTATDIDDTRRREADAAAAADELAATLALLEALQSKAPVGLGLLDREFRIVRVNEVMAALTGMPAEELVGRTVAQAVPDVWRQTEALYRRVVDGGEAVLDIEIDRTAMRGDGASDQRWLTSCYPLVLDGAVSGVGVVVVDVTDRMAGEASRALLAAIVESSGEAIIGTTVEGIVTSWNGAAERLFGYTADEVIGVPIAVLAPPGRRTEERELRSLLLAGASHERLQTVRRRKDGTMVEVLVTASTVTDGSGSIVGMSVIAHDITRRRTEERALAAAERTAAERERQASDVRFQIGFEQTGLAAAILDLDGVPTRVNAAACALLARAEHELVGVGWTEYSHDDGDPLDRAFLARVAAGHDTYAADRRFRRPDGTLVWTSLTLSVVRDEGGDPQYYLAQLQDITLRKETEFALADQALHDALTGLPNRALLTDRLRQALATSPRRGSQVGVLAVDIDHLQLFNQTHGHGTGDRLLRAVAERITSSIRPGDTVARVGSDEFVVVCADVTAREVEQIATRILDAIRRPWPAGAGELTVTASLGIAIGDGDDEPERLLREADVAMYRAKERGRGGSELFDETLRAKAARRLATASAIRYGLERREFVVHYQPVVDLVTGAMTGVEALLRWHKPGRGMVRPAEFIPIAEESGLIVPIGTWLLEQACSDVVAWQRLGATAGHGAAALSLAVNLSVHQVLAPDLVELVAGVLTHHGLAPDALCLELTESVFIEDVERVGRTMGDLKALGVALAIDDFGTGYSSLGYLRRFPVDAVKVDQSFVGGLGTNANDTALVAAMVGMARALGLDVVAEGVETRRQLGELQRLGVTRAQGYLLGRAVPAAAIAQFVSTARRWPVGAAPSSPAAPPAGDR